MHTTDEEIECHYNHRTLIKLPLEEIKANRPQHLYCNNNYITELPEDLPDSITHLTCSNNHITRLPDTLPSKLSHLNCGENNIYYLPHNLPITIEYINIEWNPLKALPNDFSKYVHLHTLILSKTLVTELPDMPESICSVTFYSYDPIFKIINEQYFSISNSYSVYRLSNKEILQINEINSRNRIQTRSRLLEFEIMEHYARRTMHPCMLTPLLENPHADVSEFMELYIDSL